MGFFDNFFTRFKKTVQTIFNQSNFETETLNYEQLKSMHLDKTTKNLLSNFFTIKQSKKELIQLLDDIKDFYFSQLIVDRIVEDALAPNSNSDLFQVSVKINDKTDEILTEYLRDFSKSMNLKKILMDVAHDTLVYGEYALRLDVINFSNESLKKGIINIHDDVDLTNLIPVYKDGGINYFLTIEDKQLKTVQPSKYAYFILPGNRIKVKVDGLDNKVLYLRMGRSVLYPVLGLLRELKFLEELVPLQMIKNFFKTKLIGVNVPNKVKPSEAIEIAKTYQKLINNVLLKNLPEDDNALLQELKSRVGDVKVIPNFDNKGQLEEIDISANDKLDDIYDKIADIRRNILITIGIPPSIIDENAGLKADIIRDNIRYTKKLKMLQQAMIEGLKDLFIIHLHNSGFTTITREDIHINFLNILDTTDIEKLEFLDLQISMLDNFKSFIEDMGNKENVELNEQEYINFINTIFEKVTGFNLFTYKKDEDEIQD